MATSDRTADAADKSTKARPQFIFITNNAHGHRILTMRGRTASGSGSLVAGGNIALICGANLVELRQWQQWKTENADVEIDGVLVIGQATQLLEGTIPRTAQNLEGEGKPWLEEGPLASSRTAPLLDLDKQTAAGIIAGMLQAPLIKAWLDAERRPDVIRLLADRLDAFRKADTTRPRAA